MSDEIQPSDRYVLVNEDWQEIQSAPVTATDRHGDDGERLTVAITAEVLTGDVQVARFAYRPQTGEAWAVESYETRWAAKIRDPREESKGGTIEIRYVFVSLAWLRDELLQLAKGFTREPEGVVTITGRIETD